MHFLKLNSFLALFLDVSFLFLNNKINRVLERCLRIISNDKLSTFKELLTKDNSVSVHFNNIHAMAIEMYKVVNGIFLEIMNEVFKLRRETHYHLRHTTEFLVDPIWRVFNGSESVFYFGPKIWEQIAAEIKNKDSLVGFKKEFKKGKPLNCPSRICKTFIANLDFI